MTTTTTSTMTPFPAKTTQSSGEVGGVQTDVMCISFADKIMITVTQGGKLAQWVQVPLLSDNPTDSDPYFATARDGEDALLPTSRFQPRTLLGAGSNDREMMGQLYASQIASLITTKYPQETRTLMLGLGLAKVDTDREVFLKTVELVLDVV